MITGIIISAETILKKNPTFITKRALAFKSAFNLKQPVVAIANAIEDAERIFHAMTIENSRCVSTHLSLLDYILLRLNAPIQRAARNAMNLELFRLRSEHPSYINPAVHRVLGSIKALGIPVVGISNWPSFMYGPKEMLQGLVNNNALSSYYCVGDLEGKGNVKVARISLYNKENPALTSVDVNSIARNVCFSATMDSAQGFIDHFLLANTAEEKRRDVLNSRSCILFVSNNEQEVSEALDDDYHAYMVNDDKNSYSDLFKYVESNCRVYATGTK